MSAFPQNTHRRIAISCGDPNGVGPEVTLKALAAERNVDLAAYTLFGDWGQLQRLNDELQLSLDLCQASEASLQNRWIVNPCGLPPMAPSPRPHDPIGADASMHWLKSGAAMCLRGEADALVTAPVSKVEIIRGGYPQFVGQTEFLSDLAHEPRTIMMLLGSDDHGRWLRVALASNHVPLRRVTDVLSTDKIELAILRASIACKDLELTRARVGVCGLNPHAGEGGEIGTEEIEIIAPAVEHARKQGLDVVGPLSADTLFHQAFRGDFDAVVAMYHDQGLVPLKMIGFETGVNWTLGLPFIRTSPDHGTAFDIAGQGIAQPSSMLAALRLAKQLARTRQRT